MKSIDLSEVSALAPLVPLGSNEPVFLKRDGQIVAVIVPADEQEIGGSLLSINPQFQAILDRSQQRLESEGGVPGAEVRRRLNLTPSESTS